LADQLNQWPPAADRARTVLTHATSVVIDIAGELTEEIDIMGVDADGSLVLQVQGQGPLGTRVTKDGAGCTLEAALVSPAPGPDRILDHVTVFGKIGPAADHESALQVIANDRRTRMIRRLDASVLLRLSIGHLLLHGEAVDLSNYAQAESDPLAPVSDHFVEHLVRGHASEVLQLAHLFTPTVVQGMRALAPIRVDRFGLTFRIDSDDRSTHARPDFPAPLRDAGQLAGAMHELQRRAARVTTCPFS